MGTFVVLVGLGVVVFLAVHSIYRDKKSGRSSCGGECKTCGGCHSMNEDKEVR